MGVDPLMVAEFLACAGPTLAAEMRARFLADLAVVEDGLRAAPQADRVQRAAHALVGLSGQAGAQGLAAQASALMAAAGAADPAAMLRLVPPVLAGARMLRAVASALPLGHPLT